MHCWNHDMGNSQAPQKARLVDVGHSKQFVVGEETVTHWLQWKLAQYACKLQQTGHRLGGRH